VAEAPVKDKDGRKFKCRLWLDRESALLYQMTVYYASGKERMKAVMSDYRDVFENIKMPFLTELYVKDKLMNKILVKSIKANQDLDESLFDVSGYKELNIEQMNGMNTKNKTGNAGSSPAVSSGPVKNEPPAR
jgi:outer membrane lipoprotein-sorting protein